MSSFGWLKRSLFVVSCYLYILSTQLLCMLSWFSGHFITSLGPFKLISPAPIVEEFGNTLPRDVKEQWMPAGRLCQSWGWSFCLSAQQC